MEGPNTKRYLRVKRKSGEVSLLGGGYVGPPPEHFCVFKLHRLDFLQFQQDFCPFSDKMGLLLCGQKSISMFEILYESMFQIYE